MSNPYQLENQLFPSFRANLNTALARIASNSLGSAAPSNTYAGMLWVDTGTNQLWLRNSANTAWVLVGDIGATRLGNAPLSSPAFTDTPIAPTPSAGAKNTQIATTEFVQNNNRPVFSVYRNGTDSSSGLNTYLLVFDTAEINDGAFVTSAYTCPRAGRYFFNASVAFDMNAQTYTPMALLIRRNGSDYARLAHIGIAGGTQTLQGSIIMVNNANDVIDFTLTNFNAGASYTVFGSSIPRSHRAMGYYMGS